MKNFLRNRFLLLPLIGLLFPVSLLAEDRLQLPEDVFPALRQILADATEQSPRMVASNLELMVADGALMQAKSGLYPTIGGFYQLTQARDKREDVSGTLATDKNYYNFSLIQPLFHWGERRNLARIGEIRRQISDDNYREAYRLLAHEIRTAYLSLISGKLAVKNASYNQKLAAEALQLAENRLKQGVISDGEIFPTRIGAEQAGLEVEKTEWQFEVAKQDFVTLTGLVTIRDEQIPSEIPGLHASQEVIESLLNQFLAQDEPDTAAVRSVRKQLAISELDYKNQNTRLRPKLNFIAGISQDEQSYSTNIAQRYGLQSQYVGLQVTWNIFDGYASRGAVAAALAHKRINEHQFKEVTKQAIQGARRAAHAVALARRQLAISERLLNNAGNFLSHTKTNFERGQASEVDVNNALAGYNSIHLSANSSRYIYLIRVSEFVSQISEDPMVNRFGQN